MNLISRGLAVSALALAVTAPALGSADAAGSNWKVLVSLDGGKAEACKVPTTATGPWKVRLRVDARRATTKLQSSATVAKGTKAVGTPWQSGWVPKGQISAVGSVKLPRGSGYSLGIGLSASQAGNGGSFVAAQIPHC